MNLYYMIWVDCLLRLRSLPKNSGVWKLYGLTFMSMAMAINLIVIMTILESHVIGQSFYNLDFNFFPGEKLDSLAKFFLLYLAFPLCLNYLMIFRGNRFEKLFLRYKSYDGKLAVSYLMFSYFSPFLLMFIAYLLGQ